MFCHRFYSTPLLYQANHTIENRKKNCDQPYSSSRSRASSFYFIWLRVAKVLVFRLRVWVMGRIRRWQNISAALRKKRQILSLAFVDFHYFVYRMIIHATPGFDSSFGIAPASVSQKQRKPGFPPAFWLAN
jgi:hypothetical protein